MHFVIEFVRHSIPPGWTLRNGWYTGNCQLCRHRGHPKGDQRRRGGIRINEDSIGYNCFNCGFSLSWYPGQPLDTKLRFLLKQGFGVSEESIQRLSFQMLRENERDTYLEQLLPSRETPYEINWSEDSLPDFSVHLGSVDISKLRNQENFVAVLQTIVDRRLDFFTDWYYSTAIGYSNRLIIPFRYRGKIVGYAARDVTGRARNKYLNKQPEDFVFNLDRQTEKKRYVIVTEGPIDALCVDGVAICSNSINRNQAKIINQLNKEVIVVPDSGNSKGNLAARAIEHGWNVSFPDWPDNVKDINDAVQQHGRYLTLKSILATKTTNTTKIKLLAKTW